MIGSNQAVAEEVLEFQIRTELLLCFYNETKKTGKAIVLTGSAELKNFSLPQVLADLAQASDKIWMKIVGPQDGIDAIKNLVKQKITIRNECAVKQNALTVFFYPTLGRLRISENTPSVVTPLIQPKVEPKPLGKCRVLIVDDSATIRKLLTKILNQEYGFEIAGEAANVNEAEAFLKTQTADVMTLDIHMPGMDGLTYLQTLNGRDHPPVVLISSVSAEDAIKVFKCLEMGAFDYIEKPKGMQLEGEADRIRETVRAAKLQKKKVVKAAPSAVSVCKESQDSRALIAIGASTGGVEALQVVLKQFPKDCPPVVIVQHIPAYFSLAFANRLNDSCAIDVKEGADGDILQRGHAYVAPGGKQMKVRKADGTWKIEITDDPPENRFQPSVDYLFRHLSTFDPSVKIVAAILTGMGQDGARGMQDLKNIGTHTIAESEETAVVYGMPRAAIENGSAIEVQPLPNIAKAIFKGFEKRKG